MPPRRHLIGRHREADDERDWRERRGAYEGLDPDDAEHPQVRPVSLPRLRDLLTHNIGGDGIRQREDDPGGPWREDDGEPGDGDEIAPDDTEVAAPTPDDDEIAPGGGDDGD